MGRHIMLQPASAIACFNIPCCRFASTLVGSPGTVSGPAMLMQTSDSIPRPPSDDDPRETQEWRDALDGIVRQGGPARALFVLKQLQEHAQSLGLAPVEAPHSA